MNLSDRGKALENKYHNDKFLEFKIIARRNKKIGIWAAKLLGISPSEAENFIYDIVLKITHDPDDSKLALTLISELKERYITMTENQIRLQMNYFYQEAKMEIASEGS